MHTAILFSIFNFFNAVYAKDRVTFLSVEEIIWDYAPEGNQIYAGDPKDTDLYLKLDKNIPLPGTKYKKSLYRQYTDETYTEPIEVPPWQGMLGPLLMAEVGDTMIVHMKNNASFPFSMHPHGVFYHKDSEGATYLDGTSGKDKLDDAVPPGENYTYVWSVLSSYGPAEDDPDCISYLYHSHNVGQIEVMMGTVGIMAVCRKNTLDENGNRKGVKGFPLLFSIMDENFSFYRAESAELAGVDEETIANNFETWKRANEKHSINGYIYGNLPGLDVCEGDTVDFYVANVGTDFDLHTMYVQGHTMEIFNQKATTFGVYPGSSFTATIDFAIEGKWILSCLDRDYIKAGMQAIFNVRKCGNKIAKPAEHRVPVKGKVRNYYITADEEIWNYAPSGVDKITGKRLTLLAPSSYGESSESDCRLNGIYKKVLYKGYADKKFTKPLKRQGNDRHLGFLGPVISAEEGDTVNVLFWNRASRPYSIQINRFQGSDNEQGINYMNGPEVAVQPNETRSYSWTVPKSVVPLPDEPDCLLGRYYSAVDQVKDTFSGLSGPVVTCKKGKLTKSKRNYDRMFYLSFSNMDETESHYFSENVERACGQNVNADELATNISFVRANTVNSINGYSFANLPGLRMTEGEIIAWLVMSVGNGMSDLHSPYFHGNTFEVDGVRSDTFPLIPDVYKTLEMTPDNPGTWLIEDQVTIISNKYGLSAYYTVNKNGNKWKPPITRHGKIRTYHVGVVEEEWDYVPDLPFEPTPGEPLELIPNGTADTNTFYSVITYYFSHQDDHHIGSKYIKALYREFTDDSFTVQKERQDDTEHLGSLGPYLKAEVGDKIRVVFKNLARFNYSIQPHGVFYDESTEGQYYKRGKQTRTQPGDSVAPGETHIYEWPVPARSGPSDDDFNCVFWYYKSAVDENADAQAGLFGPIVICKPGILDENGHRKDVNREYVLFFNVFNENASPYLRENIEKYTGKPNETFALMNTVDFFDSNIKMAINGYVFGTLHGIKLNLGESAALYSFNWGNPSTTHTIHLHGNTFTRKEQGTHRHDTLNVLPSQSTQVLLWGVNVGNWLMHCHVENHSLGGMYVMYEVVDPDKIYHP